jgi:hypothetical protein
MELVEEEEIEDFLGKLVADMVIETEQPQRGD